ncbi:DinB family protein [Flavobacterium sp.]|uniref:DinB family protein n=1 Tax=Flavobacterium sp. TaxID=239 RepID=UPI00262AC28D|nr:DinB family protein [Flavobacterium sp.]
MEIKVQYELIKSSRRVLLDYCRTFAVDDFTKVDVTFGFGSIRNLLVHVANTYEWWIGAQGLGDHKPFTPYDAISTVDQLEILFVTVDQLVEDFCLKYHNDLTCEIPVSLRKQSFNSTPLELFTHVITHEFHHKGQVLTLSRHLGYTPVDTDIIR